MNPWRSRFTVIDWGGSEIEGYPIFDLVRFSLSFQLSSSRLQTEVVRHCRVLQCETIDAVSYVLAALGHIANNLGHFPLDRFSQMTNSCSLTIQGAVN